jgi:hypothetical protein
MDPSQDIIQFHRDKMKFMEKKKNISNHCRRKYICMSKPKKKIKLISKKTQKTEWKKSLSVTGKRYHYYSILERKNEI